MLDNEGMKNLVALERTELIVFPLSTEKPHSETVAFSDRWTKTEGNVQKADLWLTYIPVNKQTPYPVRGAV